MKYSETKIKKGKFAYQSGGAADPRYGQTVGTLDIGSPKSKTKNAEAHTAPTKYGMGNYYGTGFKAPIGRMRDTSGPGMNPVPLKKLGKPPRSVV